jgi:hypothetical protein
VEDTEVKVEEDINSEDMEDKEVEDTQAKEDTEEGTVAVTVKEALTTGRDLLWVEMTTEAVLQPSGQAHVRHG